jgi:hypothetical protein
MRTASGVARAVTRRVRVRVVRVGRRPAGADRRGDPPGDEAVGGAAPAGVGADAG